MNIQFTSPIDMIFDLQEFDEHIPSLNFNVVVSVKKFNCGFHANFHAWIECKCFDEFVSELKRGGIAHLRDMNNCFELILNNDLNFLDWSFVKGDLNGFSTTLMGREKLTDDAKASICAAFSGYPKWW